MTVVPLSQTATWRTERLAPGLRFVMRRPVRPGDPPQRILQQRWEITEQKPGEFGGVDMRYEWRDVPLEEE